MFILGFCRVRGTNEEWWTNGMEGDCSLDQVWRKCGSGFQSLGKATCCLTDLPQFTGAKERTWKRYEIWEWDHGECEY